MSATPNRLHLPAGKSDQIEIIAMRDSGGTLERFLVYASYRSYSLLPGEAVLLADFIRAELKPARTYRRAGRPE